MELGAQHRGPESPSCRCWAEVNRKSENVYKPRREQAEGPPEEGGRREGADAVLRVAQGVGALKESSGEHFTRERSGARGPAGSRLESRQVRTHLSFSAGRLGPDLAQTSPSPFAES